MSLESIQQRQNSIIALASNASPSLDPMQIDVDTRERLISGAKYIAAQQTLGLSEDEVLYAISRQARAEQRTEGAVSMKPLIEREEDIMKAAIASQQDIDTNVNTGITLDPSKIESYVDSPRSRGDDASFDINDEQTYTPNDRQFDQIRQEADSANNLLRKESQQRENRQDNALARIFRAGPPVPLSESGEDTGGTASDKVAAGKSEFQFTPTEQYARTRARLFGPRERSRLGIGPTPPNPTAPRIFVDLPAASENAAGMQLAPRGEASNRVTNAVNDAIAAESMSRTKESVAMLGNIERERLIPGQQRRLFNDKIASQEASLAAATGGSFPTDPIVTQTSRRGNIQSSGVFTQQPTNFPQAAKVSDDITTPAVSSYVDPSTGAPIAVQVPLSTVISGSNTPNTGQQLNAPPSASVSEFVSHLTYNGTPYSADRPMQQVAIGPVMAELNTRFGQKFPDMQRDMGTIMDMSDLQVVSDAITRDREPGVINALSALGYDMENRPDQLEKLAVALQSGGTAGSRKPKDNDVVFATEFDNPMSRGNEINRIYRPRSDSAFAKAVGGSPLIGLNKEDVAASRSVTKPSVTFPRETAEQAIKDRVNISFLSELLAKSADRPAYMEAVRKQTGGSDSALVAELISRYRKGEARPGQVMDKAKQQRRDATVSRKLDQQTQIRDRQERDLEDADMKRIMDRALGLVSEADKPLNNPNRFSRYRAY